MPKFIPVSMPSITQLEIDYVTEAVTSTWISSQGKYINEFETRFAAYCGVDHAIAVSNGTISIHLVLKALNIGPGDEVIIPDFTFIATANAVLHTGAKPIFVDIDPFNLCLDPAKIETKITANTKAIMPVHLYGHPADMDAIKKIGLKYNIPIIEDAAEAHGSEINNQKVGGLGLAGCFSFFGNKNLTTGEGGMITTNDKKLADRCRFLRDHAMSSDKRYWHSEPGFNYRLTNLQAAIGCAQMNRVEELMQKRKDLFEWYKKELTDVENVQLNRTYPWAKNSYWMICLEIKGMNESKRDALMKWLKEKKIDSRPYFYPCSMMPYFEKVNNSVTYNIYETGIYLPTFFDLTRGDVQYICKTLKEYFHCTDKS